MSACDQWFINMIACMLVMQRLSDVDPGLVDHTQIFFFFYELKVYHLSSQVVNFLQFFFHYLGRQYQWIEFNMLLKDFLTII